MKALQADPVKAKKFKELGWWGDETLTTIFEAALQHAPDKLALIDPLNKAALVGGEPQRLTYSDLDTGSDKICQVLHSLGVVQGDRIVVQMPNTVELVLVYLAAAKMGVIISPVAIQYRESELSHIAEVVEPKAYLAFTSFHGEDYASELKGVFGEDCITLLFGEAPKRKKGLLSGLTSGKPDANTVYVEDYDEKRLAKLDKVSTWPDVTADDIFTICWTSGTTGRSKGVPRSHNLWLSTTFTNLQAARLSEDDVLLNPFPLINMAAIGGFLYFWLKLKTTMVLHHPFDPGVFLQQIQSEKVAYTIAPPAVLNMLIQQKDTLLKSFDLSSLKLMGSGSAPLSPAMIRSFKDLLGVDVLNFFGSNEGMAMIGDAVDIPDPEERAMYFPRFGAEGFSWRNEGGNRFHSILVDVETGEEVVEPGKSGEMLISGPTVFDGYYKSPDDNARAFTEDGLFRTGDLFQIAGPENRYYQFVGRCKDLIVRGGMNISPEELDIILEAHPDVVEAAVCGYPDDIMGEKVCAVVVPKPGVGMSVDAIAQFMEAKGVAKFKWPQKVVMTEKLPRNALNKVMRHALSEIVEDA